MARLIVLTLSHVLMDCMLNVVPPLTPFLVRDFGWSLAQLGAVAMMVSLSTGLLQPVLGGFVDRMGRSRPFPWTILWVGLFAGLVGWAPSFSLVLLAVIFLGIGGALFHPLAAVIVPRAADRFAGQRATVMSVFFFGGTIGIAAAPLLFTGLANQFGRLGTLWIIVPAVLLTFFNLRLGTHRIATGHAPMVHITSEADASTDGSPKREVGAASEGNDTKADARPVDRPKALAWLCMGMSLRLVVYQALITFLPLVYVARGYAEAEAGSLLTIFLLMGSVGSILGGKLADVWGRRAVTVYSSFFITPFVLGFFALDGWLSMVSLGASAVMIYASFSAVVIYAQELLPSREAQAAGLVMGFVWAVSSLSVPAIGALADRVGLESALGWIAWVAVAAGLLMLPVPETLRRKLALG